MPYFWKVFSILTLIFLVSSKAVIASCELATTSEYLLPNESVSLDITFKNTGPSQISSILLPINFSSSIGITSHSVQEPDWTSTETPDYFIYSGNLNSDESISFNFSANTNDEGIATWTWLTSEDPSGEPSEICGSIVLPISETPQNANPTISNTKITISNKDASITWNTDVESTGVINYGVTENYGGTINSQNGTEHSVRIDNLLPSTLYHYQIVVTSPGGTTSTNDATFTTSAANTTTTVTTTVNTTTTVIITPTPTPKPATDTVSPTISIKTDFSKAFSESPTITGTSSDGGLVNQGVVSIEYSLDNGKNWLPVDYISDPGKRTTSYEFTPPKLDDGNYLVKLRAKDSTGNTGTSKVSTMVIDRLPPQVGNTLFFLGPITLRPDENGNIYSIAGLPIKVVLSAVGGPISMELTYGTQKFHLKKNIESGLWTGEIKTDNSDHPEISVRSIDGANNETTRTLGTIVSLPVGKITDDKNQPVSGAKIKIYTYEKTLNDYTLWDAESYLQANPQSTNANGNYHLILPSGKYYIEIVSSGKRKVRSQIFETDTATPINQNFSLESASLFTRWWAKVVPISIITNDKSDHPNNLTGKSVPNFNLSLPNFEFSDTSILGKPTLISFISSWEPQSSDQLSTLDQFKLNNDGINVIAVTLQESVSKTDIFKKTGGYQIPIIADPDGIFVLPFNLTALPTHIFIDKKGIIKDVSVGFLNENSLLNRILK